MATEPETRNTTRLEFAPQGADGTLPETFVLICWHQHQRRDSRAAGGWVNDQAPTRRVLEAGISRRKLEVILADGIAALAYDGKDG